MKSLKVIFFAVLAFASIGQAFARCDYPSDRAAVVVRHLNDPEVNSLT